MSGKARPSLRKKTLENVRFCNLSQTDKECIFEVFRRYEEMPELVRCKDCKYAYINAFSAQSGVVVCKFWSNSYKTELLATQQDDYCSYGERKDDTK